MKQIAKSGIYVGIVLLILVIFVERRNPHPASSRVNTQSSTSTSVANNSVLLKRLKASQLTVGQLVDSLASPNADERGHAAAAVAALRSHYIDVAQQATILSLADKSRSDVTTNAFDTLAFLRPSNQTLLQEADRNISFSPNMGSSYEPIFSQSAGPSDEPSGGQEYPAARLLIRASFAALPALSKDFTTDIIQPGHSLTQAQRLRLQCVAAILTTSAPAWFRDLAASEHDAATQKSLLYCSKIISITPPNPPGAPPPPPSANFSNGRGILTDFQEADAVNEELDTDDLDQINANTYVIHWNAAAGLADGINFGVDPPVPPWPNERAVETVIASHDVERTMALLSYTICLRLNTDTNIKSKQPQIPFTEDATVDAIRVVGNLRSVTLAPYVVWQHLRRVSLKHHLEDDASPVARASLVALGQIDVPATRLLTTRIGYELSPEQQRAAAYTIGVVMGKYAVPYLSDALMLEQTDMIAETNQGYKPEFQDRITNLKNMLALGEEKRWFGGDYYGAHDPHAYEIVFGTVSAPTKMSNP